MDETAKAYKGVESRKRYREFTVTPGLCGFKVRIGCSEAYFCLVGDLVKAIVDYLLDPQGTERKFQNEDIRLAPPTCDPVNQVAVSGCRIQDR
jgi:hypothetical protein